uniref:Uncharacterized protein n=1 Tax=Cacopsylla melanoneura TaxID=428564 RepID=A0A8D9E6A7_9HEMI
MLRVTLLGLLVASVVDYSLGAGVNEPGWLRENGDGIQILSAVHLPNPVCTLSFYNINTDCDKIKPAIDTIIKNRHPGISDNAKNSETCKCVRTSTEGTNACSCTYDFTNMKGGHETYEEEVWYNDTSNSFLMAHYRSTISALLTPSVTSPPG